MSGILYIVPTPIGNLADISARAIDILTHVDLIAAEDTRHSSLLLQHYSIKTSTISLHEHNEAQRTQTLVEKLKQGLSIALISDAGTPLISDPGYTLVNTCRQKGLNVIALPGPCALVTALSASGLPTDKFTFQGFLPVKQKAKLEALQECISLAMTCIFYESPRRVKSTVEMCIEQLPNNHKMVLAKELSKRFETFISGQASDILDWLEADLSHQKGEFVLMIYCPKKHNDDIPIAAKDLLKQLLVDMPPKRAAAVVSEHYSINKKQLYEYGVSLK
ncbi:16S rRNA (cytidine(1402)-2'-O)-methyltransferase [Glaciecola petra]|uniref:Ribosomal RNA small subunit methyltransferase I n=1 Tax=Glaciecola petra TaxID=3075602 RepID=A0ABU2ZV97_9ALTE|nr:16S rRNA (cytidine(1402)-2'-O)-methyltransferase [Aestuariibacter sp. P117]MDT0596568.1 16S rRNA (cytidine(1402)-2'-O)-methyltransferase [Aestuariibacter sp. P117]